MCAAAARPVARSESRAQGLFNMEKQNETTNNNKGFMKKALDYQQTKRGGLLSKAAALQLQEAPKDTIIDHNGVFLIKEGLETSSVKQDPALKALIDSVLAPQNS